MKNFNAATRTEDCNQQSLLKQGEPQRQPKDSRRFIPNTSQEVGGQAKPYQIRQFLKLAEEYNLTLEDNEL